MYRMSQLMSTPVASSSWLEREHARELSPMCIFPSFACDFLDGDSSLECCSIDPVTGAHCPCRRSSRLLTNGYYIWTEDSFLYDKDGHISLNPSQTSVIYKENLVSASESWLHGGILGAVDSSPSEDRGLEGLRRLGMHHCNESGGDFDSTSLTDDWESEKLNAESTKASFSDHITSQPPREDSRDSCLQFQLMVSKHFRGNIWDHSKTSLLREVSCQAILLVACLIISSCVRWFMGGVLAGVFTCSLMITIAYVVKSLILHLASYVEDTACAQ
ncbi:PREDICTED: transmembrane protein 71 isoform X1 [Galeopterus variegatus]|uniref:Transmembrane protein 71 isoform X1 n=1 Tax=Galeopterus variegatus TaxID=482537 RepID=A0ABM0QJH6_GALVR|nr:PREDICTED: transmembrane protein 71 isoform X1 [Galeopterus variegatus]